MLVLKNLLLVLISSFLFFISHPNMIFQEGLAPVGFIALIPVFFVVSKSKIKNAWAYGFLYGASAYGLFSYWLAGFSPFTIYIGVPAFGVVMALVFEAMCAAKSMYPEKKFYIMALVWLAYEFIKTKGFLGYPYGIIGYTQWNVPVMVQSASIGGVWWVSLLCVSFSAVAARFLECIFDRKEKKLSFGLSAANFFKGERIPFVLVSGLFLFSLCYGTIRLNVDGTQYRKSTVACIQNNTDSNKYGFEVYKRDVAALKNLTESALDENPGIDFVIWPETAVVPPFLYNYASESNANRHRMVLDLIDFMSSHDACFVFGNQTSVDNGGEYPDDYNSALVFDVRKGNVNPPGPGLYCKIHLVPFTEYFPYEKIFPRLYEMLLMGDTHLWTPGSDYTVFNERGISFSTPICFEDCFGNLCRSFVKNGARCLFNLTNDSWSRSVPCQTQHLSMAVFRSVENAVPSARATASGATCFIDSRGRIYGKTRYFARNYSCAEINVPENYSPTIYNRLGDWLPLLEILILVFLIVFRAVLFLRRKTHAHLKNSAEME